jgi:two-component system response regulator AtoC
MFRVLIVDDEQSMRFTLQEVLKKEDNIETETANDGEAALRALRERPFDLVIMDVKMPRLDGMSALREIKKREPLLPVIMMTAYGSRQIALEALRNGASDYFSKPFEVDELRIVVRRALEKQARLRQIESLRAQLDAEKSFDRIIGAAPAMRELFRLLKRLAISDVTVLIQGESGTGKELVAQAIHRNSTRREGPFVSINCAAIPENLLESELFGHERGAFTGAIAQKPGKFEIASGGSVFLDEIGEMPLSLQAKMLRVLQERVIERVGGTKPMAVDLRVIAATNRDLRQEVEAGNFREDLFFRLNVVPARLPPLRERREDIALLADHFLLFYSQKFQRPIRGFTDEAAAAIRAYRWPGNVRELENALQRAIILSTEDIITLADLPANIYQSEQSTSREPGAPDENDFNLSLQDKIAAITERYEKTYILAALQKARFHRQDTADLLGISRKSLHNKMLKYNLFDTAEEREMRRGGALPPEDEE